MTLKVVKSILPALTVLVFVSGCSRENQNKEKSNVDKKQTHTSSVMINYDVTGVGKGKIVLYSKNGNIRANVQKQTDSTTQNESRYINEGYVYFFVDAGGYLKGVKVPVTKDYDYHKSFTAFLDAGEILPGMQKTGSEMVAGMMCDVYKHADGSLFSVYNGKYVLKAIFGNNTITAREFVVNADIPDTLVIRPKDFEFTEITP